MWRKIKNFFANRAIILQKKQERKKVRFQNLQESRNILILATCATENSFRELEQCEKKLNSLANKFETTTLIFIGKSLEKNSNLNFGKHLVVSRKELDWRGLPKKEIIENVSKNEFDLLIDLSEKSSLAHFYLVHSLKAVMSVGRFSFKNKAHFDFMIQFEKTWNMPEFLNQIIHYLSQINQKKAA